MPFEVLNGLRYNSQLEQEEIVMIGNALSKFKIALYPLLNGELVDLCVKCALRYGLTIYDASYLALSKTFDKEFYTADEKMLAKISSKEKISHLKEYET
jgi:predicted nucleic acid-binding protein